MTPPEKGDKMVWKDNFMVDGSLKTLEGFLDEVFSLSTSPYGLEDLFLFHFPLAYFKDPRDMIMLGFHFLDKKHFPKHFLFANFQCLRCGLCCKNYECVPVYGSQVKEWELERRDDILKYVVIYARSEDDKVILAEIYSRGITGCPLCRKVRGKPYYKCKIHSAKENLPVCKAYLCSKSIPVAHLNYESIDELIEMIGLESYYSLIERDWGEEFDYSKCMIKTHKRK